jgi:ABC-type sugar transport system substrate-binding protein
MKDRTIGVFLLARQNEYQRLQEASATAMAHLLKTPLDVHFSESDAYIQTDQIHAFVHAHPSGSVLVVESVVDETLEPVARHAARAGMGWYLLHRIVAYMPRLRGEFPALPIGTVTSDQKEIGRIQGKHFEALLSGKGKVLYVQGPAGSSIAADRLAGMREIIDPSPIEYHLVRGDWSEESGEAAVAKWLEENHARAGFQLVGCQNDAMAVGALRALARGSVSYGLDAVPVTGVDGNPDYGIQLVDHHHHASGGRPGRPVDPRSVDQARFFAAGDRAFAGPLVPGPVARGPPRAALRARAKKICASIPTGGSILR